MKDKVLIETIKTKIYFTAQWRALGALNFKKRCFIGFNQKFYLISCWTSGTTSSLCQILLYFPNTDVE